MKSINRLILKDSAVVFVLGIIGQALGFVVTMTIARNFGASWITDAYYLTFIIPNTFLNIIGGILKVIFLPLLVKEKVEHPERMNESAGSVITLMLIVSAVGVIIVAVMAMTNIVGFGQVGEARLLTKKLTVELLPLIPLILLLGTYSALYSSYQKFGLMQLANLCRYVIVVGFVLFFSKKYGIHSMVLGHIVGLIVAVLLSATVVKKVIGLRISPKFIMMPIVKEMIKLSKYPALTTIFAQFNPLISRAIASFLAIGSISYLSYAEKLSIIPSVILGTGLFGVITSYWTKSLHENNTELMGNSLNKLVSTLFMVLMPMIIGLYLLRVSLIRLILMRGQFDELFVAPTAEIFSILAISIIPNYLYSVIVRVLHINQEVKALFYLSILSMISHLSLSFFLTITLKMGVRGIAMATVVSNLVVMLVTAYYVHIKYVKFNLKRLLISSSHTIGSCGIMYVVIKLSLLLTGILFADVYYIYNMAIVVISGFVGYSLSLYFLRHPDGILLINIFINKLRYKPNT